MITQEERTLPANTFMCVVLKVPFFQKVRCIFQIAQKMCQKNYPEQEIWQLTGTFFVILYRELP